MLRDATRCREKIEARLRVVEFKKRLISGDSIKVLDGID